MLEKLRSKLGFAPRPKMAYRELPESAVEHMNRQRAFVAQLAAEQQLGPLTGSMRDIEVLEEIVSRRLLSASQTWELQSLGVAFGDALIAEEPQLHWMEVTDEWGTDPVLVFGETTCQVGALTVISKRVEDSEPPPFVRYLATSVLSAVRDEAKRCAKR